MNDRALENSRIAQVFEQSFGSTPLDERLADIVTQATSLSRFRDLMHLQDEAGDLLCSVLQLCNECGWTSEQLIDQTLAKILARSDVYQRLGRKIRVAIHGDAFDPVHHGHLQVAKATLATGKVDEVWLMPCFDPLGEKSIAPAETRLRMCQLAADTERGLNVFDYEIAHQFRGETYHLVKKLLNEELARLRCDFSLIIGQDSAEAFSSWSNYQSLKRLIPFIVVPQAGVDRPAADAWYLQPPHLYLNAIHDDMTINSTLVKHLIATQNPAVEKLVPPSVSEFIKTNSLYRPTVALQPAPPRRIAIYTDTFDPPTRSQREDVVKLRKAGFDEVVVCPMGPRLSGASPQYASPMHRAALVSLGFCGVDGVTVDYDDISQNRYSSLLEVTDRHRSRGEIWHVVDADRTVRSSKNSDLSTALQGLESLPRSDSRFVVFHPEDDPPSESGLPGSAMLVKRKQKQSSEQVRQRVSRDESISEMVEPRVEHYISRHHLFLHYTGQQFAYFKTSSPRFLIVADPRNPKSMAAAERFKQYESDQPELVLVLGGDGTMLHAIKEHWRLRVPFVGVNTGHLGFLMNESLPTSLRDLELISYTLPMLRVDAESPDGERSWGLAFSDVWVERAEGQAAWLRLDVDGETRVSKVVGDGMLVATASGSSAYARAMGAMPVPLNTPTVTLAGSNIFQPRFWKPMTLPHDSLVTLASLDRSGKRPVRSFIDGASLGIVQQLSIKRSLTASVELAFTREFDPSARLLRSFFPPDDA